MTCLDLSDVSNIDAPDTGNPVIEGQSSMCFLCLLSLNIIQVGL